MWIRVPFFFFTKLLFISFEPIIGLINFKKVNALKFQALMIKHLVKSVWASPKAGGLISGTDNLLIFSIQGFLPCLGQLTMLMYFYICLHPDPVPNFFSSVSDPNFFGGGSGSRYRPFGRYGSGSKRIQVMIPMDRA